MNILKAATYLATLVLLGAHTASAQQPTRLEVSYTQTNPFSGKSDGKHPALMLSGPIVPGDYQRLLKFIGKDEDKFWEAPSIVLSSPGGDIREALKIADLVKNTYKDVSVGPYTGQCASSCFLIFAAANKRIALPGVIGIHRPYLQSSTFSNLTVQEAQASQRELMHAVHAYLSDLQVPTYLIDAMLSKASTEIYWLTNPDLTLLGNRSYWYEQLLISRCNLNKEIEKHYFETNDSASLPEMMRVWRCGDVITGHDASSYLDSELSKLR